MEDNPVGQVNLPSTMQMAAKTWQMLSWSQWEKNSAAGSTIKNLADQGKESLWVELALDPISISLGTDAV